ncbi:MAG: response regulator [Verrucomicrobiota bacterium]
MATILVIDDDEQVRFLVQTMLRRAGHEVSLASNGNEGLAAYRANPTALVITDLIMPEKEGLETIQELKQAYPACKIIAMSGGMRQGTLDFLPVAKRLGADYVLPKPFNRSELLAAVAEVLGEPDAAPPKA